MFVKTSLVAALWIIAADVSNAEGHLAVAMDRDRQLFVSTTLDRKSVNELSFGLDQTGLHAFKSIDVRGLEELAAATFRLDPGAEVTIWVDPNARPMGWPAGWRADSDLLDPSTYVQMLLGRAYETAVPAAARTGQPMRFIFLPVLFPPPVPLHIGSH